MSTTVDKEEISKFTKEAAHWWDDDGVYSSLHKANPTRIKYLTKTICRHFKIDEFTRPLMGKLKILDIGCGGGLVSEPMAELGARITGIDADANAIKVASGHARKNKLDIEYINEDSGQHIMRRKESYDVVMALEIIEHIKDVQLFINHCEKLCKPGGMVIFSSINRTSRSYALMIVAAEKMLRWVPAGTHDWNKFVKPAELAGAIRKTGMEMKELKGFVYKPLKDDFDITPDDVGVNYFAIALKDKY